MGEARILYLTKDGGDHFQKVNLNFLITGELIFHTSENYKDHIMAMEHKVGGTGVILPRLYLWTWIICVLKVFLGYG